MKANEARALLNQQKYSSILAKIKESIALGKINLKLDNPLTESEKTYFRGLGYLVGDQSISWEEDFRVEKSDKTVSTNKFIDHQVKLLDQKIMRYHGQIKLLESIKNSLTGKINTDLKSMLRVIQQAKDKGEDCLEIPAPINELDKKSLEEIGYGISESTDRRYCTISWRIK